MSIVETMSRAIVAVQTGVDVGAITYVHDEATRCARAALRAVKPGDISEAMCDAACDALHGLPPDVVAEVRQRFSSMFVSAAIAAGAEQ